MTLATPPDRCDEPVFACAKQWNVGPTILGGRTMPSSLFRHAALAVTLAVPALTAAPLAAQKTKQADARAARSTRVEHALGHDFPTSRRHSRLAAAIS